MVEMKNIQKWVSTSCTDLALEFFLNYTIEFANGRKAVVTAFIPNLGSKIGTIVMTEKQLLKCSLSGDGLALKMTSRLG